MEPVNSLILTLKWRVELMIARSGTQNLHLNSTYTIKI